MGVRVPPSAQILPMGRIFYFSTCYSIDCVATDRIVAIGTLNFITQYFFMQVILVPIDFSPQSRNAAVHAAMLAKSFHGKILLFHAYMLPTPVSEVPYVMVTVDDLQKDNEQLIKKEAEHLNNEF